MYNPIEDYGIIGDMNTAALVSRGGSIDFCCFPYFDSPTIFAAMLDANRGGFFRIGATALGARNKQLYIPDTNVLVTRFLSREGVGEVVDFMPVDADDMQQNTRRRIVRRVTAVRGQVHFRLECRPAFNYALDPLSVRHSDHGFIFEGNDIALELLSPVTLEEHADGVTGNFTLSAGETIVFVLQLYEEGRLYGTADPEMDQGYRATVQFWQSWLSQCRYQGRWREMVHRSALLLKLLTFRPTGAIIAAPTTSLPEVLGGKRNWDYRYTWIRDATFTVYALLRIGFRQEATAFMNWLEERLGEMDGPGSLRLMYRIDGSSDLSESVLDHLEGYMRSPPVRVGNEAHGQLQLDIYGALMDAIYLYDKYGTPLSFELWGRLRDMLDWLCDHWEEPDEGIWEVRGGRQQFVYSKLMCWVAFDRGLRLANKRSYPANRARWEETRDAIYLEIMEQGWNKERGSFMQAFGTDALDAANLLMPMVFFSSPTDPRLLSTIDATMAELVSDSLVYRYHVHKSPDGLDGDEGTFSMCTFWLVEALTRAGRLDEARIIFEKMIGYANHLGLYSEEIGHSGEALGNFPQALTHLGLISAAFNLDRALDQRKGG